MSFMSEIATVTIKTYKSSHVSFRLLSALADLFIMSGKVCYSTLQFPGGFEEIFVHGKARRD